MNSHLIYDIGMNNGDDTAYYLSLGYKVIAVEAAPNLADAASERFKSFIEENKLQILNIGISECEGSMPFYINKYDSGWNSFDLNLGSRGGSGYDIIEVKTKTLDQVISEYGVPYYLKVDIEGYDRIAINSLLKCAEKPRFISIELYSIEEITLLGKLGYTKFKIIDQQNFLPLEIPATKEYLIYKKLTAFKTSRYFVTRVIRKLFGKMITGLLEKKYKHFFNYNHTLGSSGPFGENYPGKWHSFNEIKELFIYYKTEFEQLPGNKENGWWIDIHATC